MMVVLVMALPGGCDRRKEEPVWRGRTCVTGRSPSCGKGVAQYCTVPYLLYDAPTLAARKKEKCRSSPAAGIHGRGWRVHGFSAHFHVRTYLVRTARICASINGQYFVEARLSGCSQQVPHRIPFHKSPVHIDSINQQPDARPTRREFSKPTLPRHLPGTKPSFGHGNRAPSALTAAEGRDDSLEPGGYSRATHSPQLRRLPRLRVQTGGFTCK
jgi:hypothetical protein